MTSQYCIPENLVEKSCVYSPSGKFKLAIESYKTGNGTWNYTSGILTRVKDDKFICRIDRNYSQFTYNWFVKNDQEWLQTGYTYMSQAFINLDTGEIINNEERLKQTEQYKIGSSFCWVECFASSDGNTLAVYGCYWACPYEYKFFDFTNPYLQQWPELEYDDYIDCVGGLYPKWIDNDTIIIYGSYDMNEDGNLGEEDIWIENQKRTMKRIDNKMVTIDLWQSDEKQLEEQKWAEEQTKREELKKNQNQNSDLI